MLPAKSKSWLVAFGVFAILFALYASVDGGGGWNQDSRMNLLRAIYHDSRLIIDPYHHNTGDKSFFDGHYYSDKAPGIAMVSLPGFALAAEILRFSGIHPNHGSGWELARWLSTALSAGMIVAAGGMVSFLFLDRFVGRSLAFLVTIGAFVGSMPFPYAVQLFSHGIVVSFLSIALYFVWAGREPDALDMTLAGAFCGLAVIGEHTSGVAAIAVGIMAMVRSPRKTAWLVLGGLPPVAALLAYNHVVFGTPFQFGYSHVQGWEGMNTGLFGVSVGWNPEVMGNLLFSVPRGLFFWTPMFLLALPGLPALYRTSRLLFYASAAATLLHLFLISGYAYWDGGTTVGPRHLSSVIPFLLLPTCFGLRRFPRTGCALVVLSVILTGFATILNITNPGDVRTFADALASRMLYGPGHRNVFHLLGLSPLTAAWLYAVYFLFAFLWNVPGMRAAGIARPKKARPRS